MSAVNGAVLVLMSAFAVAHDDVKITEDGTISFVNAMPDNTLAPELGFMSTVVMSTTPIPSISEKLRSFTNTRADMQASCYFNAEWGAVGPQSNNGIIVDHASGLEAIVNEQNRRPPPGPNGNGTKREIVSASGGSYCWVEQSDTEPFGVYCSADGGKAPPFQQIDRNAFKRIGVKHIHSLWSNSRHIVYSSDKGIFLHGPVPADQPPLPFWGASIAAGGLHKQILHMPRIGGEEFEHFHKPSVLVVGEYDLALAFLAAPHSKLNGGKHATPAQDTNLYLWESDNGMRMLLADGQRSTKMLCHSANDTDGQWEDDVLTNFSDPCIGTSSSHPFVAFAATGKRCKTRGLFVHYVEESSTVAVALEGGILGAAGAHPGDSWKDFSPPSCAEKYVSFYGSAGSSSGLYVSMIERPTENPSGWKLADRPPTPDATIRAVIRNPNATLWKGPPQVTGDSLFARTEMGAARLCFSAEYQNGTTGVFQADFEVPYPCATHHTNSLSGHSVQEKFSN